MGSFFEALTDDQRRELRRLSHSGVPAIMVQLIAMVFLSGLLGQYGLLAAFETFAGEMNITKALARRGFACAAMELKWDPTHDIMSEVGYVYAVVSILRVQPGGLVWLT